MGNFLTTYSPACNNINDGLMTSLRLKLKLQSERNLPTQSKMLPILGVYASNLLSVHNPPTQSKMLQNFGGYVSILPNVESVHPGRTMLGLKHITSDKDNNGVPDEYKWIR